MTVDAETSAAAPYFIDALAPAGAYRSGRRETVRDVAGEPVAELTLAPGLFIARTLDRSRHRLAHGAGCSRAELAERLRAAATAFASGTPGGLTPEEHHVRVARTTG
ncbi:hypothetical protein AN219_34600, partial [Streptomyces nanshensis]